MLAYYFVCVWPKTPNIKFTILTFLSVKFNKVQYIHSVVQQISGSFSCFNTETLYPLNINHVGLFLKQIPELT